MKVLWDPHKVMTSFVPNVLAKESQLDSDA